MVWLRTAARSTSWRHWQICSRPGTSCSRQPEDGDGVLNSPIQPRKPAQRGWERAHQAPRGGLRGESRPKVAFPLSEVAQIPINQGFLGLPAVERFGLLHALWSDGPGIVAGIWVDSVMPVEKLGRDSRATLGAYSSCRLHQLFLGWQCLCSAWVFSGVRAVCCSAFGVLLWQVVRPMRCIGALAGFQVYSVGANPFFLPGVQQNGCSQ